MRRLLFISFLLLFFANHQVNAQIAPFHGTVEILEMGADSTFVFQVTCSTAKKSDLKTIAEKTALYALLFDGVEGVNNDEKIVKRNNRKYFENLFYNTDKHSPHNRFIEGAILEGDVTKLGNSEYQGTFNISVRYKALCREMKLQKLTEPDPALKENKQNEKTDFR